MLDVGDDDLDNQIDDIYGNISKPQQSKTGANTQRNNPNSNYIDMISPQNTSRSNKVI
jgi:hypothetical protein